MSYEVKRRPGVTEAASESFGGDLNSVATATRSAQDDALAQLAELNRRAGYEAAAREWIEDQEAVRAHFAAAGLWRHPRHAELVERRRPSDDPCRRRCGACSQCIRAAAVERNLGRYGMPDFPGVTAGGVR